MGVWGWGVKQKWKYSSAQLGLELGKKGTRLGSTVPSSAKLKLGIPYLVARATYNHLARLC